MNDSVYLHLNHDYHLLNKSSLKLSNQCYDLFEIQKKIEILTYELELSET